MASIFKRPDGPHYFAAFRDALGRRKQRTTKTTDRTLAIDLAIKWERAAASGRAGTFVEANARKVLSEIHESVHGTPITFHTTAGWVDEWLLGRAGTAAPGTVERYKSTCNAFIKFLGEKSKLALGTVQPADVRRFRDKMQVDGYSAATCNQTLKILSGPFGQAHRLGLIPTNPIHGVHSLRDDVTGAKRVPFTREQLGDILKASPNEDWRGLVLLGALAGLRLMDAAQLRWQDIDFDGGMIRVVTRKRRHAIQVPLHPSLLAWLSKRTRGVGLAHVMPSLAERSGTGRSGLSSEFKKIMKAAKVVGAAVRQGKGEGRSTSALSFHSTRHYFANAMAAAGIPADVRMRLTGHQDAKSHAVYTADEIQSLQAAVRAVPALVASEVAA
jgi:integrase